MNGGDDITIAVVGTIHAASFHTDVDNAPLYELVLDFVHEGDKAAVSIILRSHNPERKFQ